MAKVCLECATPKFMGKLEKGLQRCQACKKDTHTIDSTPRRPLCHDCKSFLIKCQDGVWRPALDYGKTYLAQASCGEGDGGVRDSIADFIGPKVAKYEYSCPAFKRHRNAPPHSSENPLSPQERREWKEYLEMPAAFWLEPRRWEGVIDSHKEMFWDKREKGGGKAKTLAVGVALLAGLFMAKKVDTKKSGVTPES